MQIIYPQCPFSNCWHELEKRRTITFRSERIVKCSISHFSFVVVFDIAFSVDKK